VISKPDPRFRVSGFRFRVSGFKFQVPRFPGFQVSGFRFQVPGSRFQILDLKFFGLNLGMSLKHPDLGLEACDLSLTPETCDLRLET
jgi:hypothetical protein